MVFSIYVLCVMNLKLNSEILKMGLFYQKFSPKKYKKNKKSEILRSAKICSICRYYLSYSFSLGNMSVHEDNFL